jgi:cell wall-associated NlpC family hydrolase
MKNTQDLILIPRPITPEELVQASRKFRGMDYQLGAAIVWGQNPDCTYQGACDCVGLWLLTARELGLLRFPFDINVSFNRYEASREAVLLEMLRLNFTAIPRDDRQPGDLLFLRYPGVEENRERHVAILTGTEPDSLIHALNRPAGTGKVCERLMDANDVAITSKVWRLNLFCEVPSNG